MKVDVDRAKGEPSSTEKQNNEFKWSLKFKVTTLLLAFSVLAGSHQASVWADRVSATGDVNEAFVLALISLISLPCALICIGMVAWKINFNVPTRKTSNWMKVARK